MLKKRVLVHLGSGIMREHEIYAIDEADYREKVVKCATALLKNSGVLQFGTPFGLYKILNVAGVEFTDPPQTSEKLPIGFRTISED